MDQSEAYSVLDRAYSSAKGKSADVEPDIAVKRYLGDGHNPMGMDPSGLVIMAPTELNARYGGEVVLVVDPWTLSGGFFAFTSRGCSITQFFMTDSDFVISGTCKLVPRDERNRFSTMIESGRYGLGVGPTSNPMLAVSAETAARQILAPGLIKRALAVPYIYWDMRETANLVIPRIKEVLTEVIIKSSPLIPYIKSMHLMYILRTPPHPLTNMHPLLEISAIGFDGRFLGLGFTQEASVSLEKYNGAPIDFYCKTMGPSTLAQIRREGKPVVYKQVQLIAPRNIDKIFHGMEDEDPAEAWKDDGTPRIEPGNAESSATIIDLQRVDELELKTLIFKEARQAFPLLSHSFASDMEDGVVFGSFMRQLMGKDEKSE